METPETDALELSLTTWTISDLDKAINACRKLERERDEARQQLLNANAMLSKRWDLIASNTLDERNRYKLAADALAKALRESGREIVTEVEVESMKIYNEAKNLCQSKS